MVQFLPLATAAASGDYVPNVDVSIKMHNFISASLTKHTPVPKSRKNKTIKCIFALWLLPFQVPVISNS